MMIFLIIGALITLAFWGLYHSKHQQKHVLEADQNIKGQQLLLWLGYFFLGLSLFASILSMGAEIGVALWLLLLPVPVILSLFLSRFLKDRKVFKNGYSRLLIEHLKNAFKAVR